jgi:hypothetical protein
MCGIEEVLWVLVAGLIAPIAIRLLCRLGHGCGQRLPLAYRRLRFEAGCNGCAAEFVQRCGKSAGRGLRHGKSKVLRGASGAG